MGGIHPHQLESDEVLEKSIDPKVRAALIKLSHGTRPDPQEHLLAFMGMPSAYRPSVLAPIARMGGHTLGDILPAEPPETAAPTLEPKTKHITQAVLLPTGAPGTTHQIKQVIISLKGARGIPTPNDRRLSDIMYRSLRAVLFYDPPNDPTGKFKRRSDRFLLNSYCTPAHQDPHKEECWLITDIDGDHKFLIRTDFMDESNRDYLQHLYVVFEFTICTE